MPSSTYGQIARAMRDKKPMACVYDGHAREFCPVVLGHSRGEEKALVYQFAGSTSKGRLVAPEWKCFFVSRMRSVALRDDAWRSGGLHRKAQTCVEDVDLDINPASPYRPRRRLDEV